MQGLHPESAEMVDGWSENCDSYALEGTNSVPSCQDKKSHNHNLRNKVKTCGTEPYKTVSDSSDSGFTTHETNEFTEKDVCEDGVACITEPLKPDDFVVLKLANK